MVSDPAAVYAVLSHVGNGKRPALQKSGKTCHIYLTRRAKAKCGLRLPTLTRTMAPLEYPHCEKCFRKGQVDICASCGQARRVKVRVDGQAVCGCCAYWHLRAAIRSKMSCGDRHISNGR